MYKKLILIMISIICIIILYLIFKNNMLNIFKEGKSLNYNKEIAYIEILGYFGTDENRKRLTFDNKDDINKIINYINSLEIIETERPGYDYLDDKGLIHIIIFGNEDVLDSIIFTNRYMVVYHNGYDWEYTDYYIKDSEYNFKSKKTKIYEYFNSLANQ